MDSEPVDPMHGEPEVPADAEVTAEPEAPGYAEPEAEPVEDPEPAADSSGAGGDGAGPAALPPGPSGEDRVWAMMAHLLGTAGYLVGFGMAGWVGPLVLWVKCRERSRFVAFHALQSFLFQIFAGVLLFVGWRVAVFDQDLMYLLWFAGAVPAVWSAAAAIRTFHGLSFEYPVVGRWALELTDDKS